MTQRLNTIITPILILSFCLSYGQSQPSLQNQALKFVKSLKTNGHYPMGGRDTLIDLNGDKFKDILIEFYASAGTGEKNGVKVFLYKNSSKKFVSCTQLNHLANPTFYRDKKIVVGYYLGDGGGNAVKLKWNVFKLDTLEHIKIDVVNQDNTIHFNLISINYLNKKKTVTTLNMMALPKEYRYLNYEPIIKKNSKQNKYLASNYSIIDSSISLFKKQCAEHKPSKEITARKIALDKKVLIFLNDFYNLDLSIEDIRKKLNPFFKSKWVFRVKDLGGFVRYGKTIKSEGNLDVSISFAIIEDKIVYKNISFYTKTDVVCNVGSVMNPCDVYYLKSNCLPYINFPIKECIECYPIQSDTIYLERIKNSTTLKYYRLLDTSSQPYSFTWDENGMYDKYFAPDDIRKLVRNKDIEQLTTLLYSHNHIIAVFAMEALVFLNKTQSIELQSSTNAKIIEIAESDFPLERRYSMEGPQGKTYKDMKVSEAKIISKYQDKSKPRFLQ